MASYAHTYTVTDYSYDMVEGEKVIVQIMYTVATTRSSPSGSCTMNKIINFSRDSKNWVIPRHIPVADVNKVSFTPQARTDFTSFDSLTIPDDLVSWIQSYYDTNSQRLAGLDAEAEITIGE